MTKYLKLCKQKSTVAMLGGQLISLWLYREKQAAGLKKYI
jgi:hypothetical protein